MACPVPNLCHEPDQEITGGCLHGTDCGQYNRCSRSNAAAAEDIRAKAGEYIAAADDERQKQKQLQKTEAIQITERREQSYGSDL